MAFNPLAQIPTGVATTTQLNAAIVALNQLAAGLSGQSATAAASSTLTLTTSSQDVPGATLTVTVSGANAFAIVTACFDFKVTTAVAGNFLLGAINLNGSDQTSQAGRDASVANSETMSIQCLRLALNSGSNTIKLRAVDSNAGIVATVGITHTTITALVFDIP